jgi:hypothetical protein
VLRSGLEGDRHERLCAVEGNRFDDLVKAYASHPTRRGLLRRLIGAATALAAGSAVVASTEAASCRAAGTSCAENAQCCSGTCGPKDQRGRRVCVCPSGGRDCGGACCPNGVACNPKGGCCADVGNAPEGSSCRDDSDCCSGVCNEYAGFCYDGCVPDGGRSYHSLACCSGVATSGPENDPFESPVCIDCVPVGWRTADVTGSAGCCSGYPTGPTHGVVCVNP